MVKVPETSGNSQLHFCHSCHSVDGWPRHQPQANAPLEGSRITNLAYSSYDRLHTTSTKLASARSADTCAKLDWVNRFLRAPKHACKEDAHCASAKYEGAQRLSLWKAILVGDNPCVAFVSQRANRFAHLTMRNRIYVGVEGLIFQHLVSIKHFDEQARACLLHINSSTATVHVNIEMMARRSVFGGECLDLTRASHQQLLIAPAVGLPGQILLRATRWQAPICVFNMCVTNHAAQAEA